MEIQRTDQLERHGNNELKRNKVEKNSLISHNRDPPYCQPPGGDLLWSRAYHSPGLRRRPSNAVGVVVEHSVLDHGSEHKQEADGDKQIHGRHVGHAGERVPGHGAQRGHGQHSGDAWGRSRDAVRVTFARS